MNWQKYYIEKVILHALKYKDEQKCRDNKIKINFIGCDKDELCDVLKNINEIKTFVIQHKIYIKNNKTCCNGFDLVVKCFSNNSYYQIVINNSEYQYNFTLANWTEDCYKNEPIKYSPSHMFGYYTWCHDNSKDLTQHIKNLDWSYKQNDLIKLFEDAQELILDGNITCEEYDEDCNYCEIGDFECSNNINPSSGGIGLIINGNLKSCKMIDVLSGAFESEKICKYYDLHMQGYSCDNYVFFIKLKNYYLKIKFNDDNASCAGHWMQIYIDEMKTLEDCVESSMHETYTLLHKETFDQSYFVGFSPLIQAYL